VRVRVCVQTPQDMQKASEEFVMTEGNFGAEASGLFGWANNNPSSKNAFYDTEFINSAAGGGNVGEMMIAMRGKGRTQECKEVQIPVDKKGARPLMINYRQMGQPSANGPCPILFVHGVLDHSWSWRPVMTTLSAQQACYAIDMPGCGYSSWPQPGMDFDYSEEEIKKILTRFVDSVGLPKVALVVQGFVYSQYALLWALENPDRVDRIVVLNTPLLPGTEMPFVLKQYTLPVVSNFVAQDAMRSERFLEGGSAYAMDVDDTDRYREPFLESMMPGLALVDVMGKCKFDQLLSKVESKVKASNTKVRVAWGMDDPYLAPIDAKAFCDSTGAEFVPVEGKAGFTVQMDYPENLCNAIGPFLRSAGPAGAVPAAAAAPVPAATAAAPAPAAAASAPAAAAAPPPLPAGWYAAIDEPTGKEYYYNAEGAVTWERPK